MQGRTDMSESPPNRNPAYQAVVRRLLADRPQPRKVPGKTRAKPAPRKKAKAR
jgi:hypothetical protein